MKKTDLISYKCISVNGFFASIFFLMMLIPAHAQFTGGDGRTETSLKFSFSSVPTYVAEIQGPTEGWRILGTPVYGATYKELLEGVWSQGFPNAAFAGGESSVYVYDEPTRTFNPPTDALNIVGTTSYNATNTPGKAALFYIYEDDNRNGMPNDWPKKLSLRGDVNTGDITLQLSNTVFEPSDLANGWHMVSNPYNFPISWIEMVEQNAITGISPAIYIFDSNSLGETDGYRINLGTAPGALPENQTHNGILMPFQGFWVQVTNEDGPGVIEFKESFQVEQTGSLFNTEDELDIPSYITLSLSGPAGEMATVLQFSGDSYGVVERPFSMSGNKLEFGFSGNSLRSLVMINQPIQFQNELLLPIMFDAEVSGSYTIRFSDHQVLSNSWIEKVELYDSIDDSWYEIEKGTELTFDFVASNHQPQKRKAGLQSPEFPSASITKNKTTFQDRFTLKVTPGTTVNLPVESDMPQKIALDQNYPNPFNPVTQIRFELPDAADVRLDVFNIQGQMVATLIHGTRQPGIHTMSFDASALASGVYLYRLRAGQTVITKKMTLLK